jgi:hypothetical protein
VTLGGFDPEESPRRRSAHSEISFNHKETTMASTRVHHHEVWNKGKLVGQKAPFKLKQIWSIRFRL